MQYPISQLPGRQTNADIAKARATAISHTPARTLSESGLKCRVLKLPVRNLKMMMKNGLDLFWNPLSPFRDTC